MKLQLLLFLNLILYTVSSQSIQKLQKDLTDNSNKAWKFSNSVSEFLGDTCTGGIRYNFQLNGKKVQKKECINGKWNSQILNWQIFKEKNNMLLSIGANEKYFLQFVTKNQKYYMRLRKFNPAINEPTIDDYYEPAE